MTITKEEIQWADEQVGAFAKVRPQYEAFAVILEQALNQIAMRYDSQAIVKTRAKEIVSFADKIWRKKVESTDPVNQFTDLCGGRIIASNLDQVAAICRFIERAFEIDKENSISTSQRLKPTEFDYRSIHYVVRIDPEKLALEGISISVPPDLLRLKAEIQVRTVLEHSWADFSHRVGYKQGYEMPAIWKREMSKLSAFMEEADQKLISIQKGLGHYLRSYGAYMTEDQMRDEITILTNVLIHEKEDKRRESLSFEIARLASELLEWTTVLTVLEPFKNGNNPAILCTYGLALCNKNDHYKLGDPSSEGYHEYLDGQSLIETARQLRPNDVAITCALAGTCRIVDDVKAEELYRLAFTLDPTNPYPLSYYLDYVARCSFDQVTKEYLRPLIKGAYTKSRELADVNLDVPWSFFNMGKFSLFLGDPYDALQMYIKGCQSSTTAWPILQALRSLKYLRGFGRAFHGQDWIEKFLTIYLTLTNPEQPGNRDYQLLRPEAQSSIKDPVIIVSGGTDRTIANEIAKYHSCLVEAFRDFKGTIVSGGTKSGICDIVGDCQEKYGDHISTIGYLPHQWMTIAGDPEATKEDKRYREARKSSGNDFSPLEPLLFWEDIIAAKIPPEKIKLIGINGGRIAATEFRMALALGAKVGIVKDSGRAAGDLLADPDWNLHSRLYPLPKDPETLREFVNQPTSLEDFSHSEELAELLHEQYREKALKTEKPKIEVLEKYANLFEWRALPEELKDSNLQQVFHIPYKLRLLGYEMREVEERLPNIIDFKPEEIRYLAEVEHGRWNVERLSKGWRWGPEKDITRKINPSIISWHALSEPIREYDLETVRDIPKNLAKIGIELVRVGSSILDGSKHQDVKKEDERF